MEDFALHRSDRFARSLASAAIGLLLVLVAPAAQAAVGALQVAGGAFDTAGDTVGELDLALLFSPLPYGFEPTAGLAVNSEGAGYVFGGMRRPLPIGRWALIPGFGVTLYEHGGGKDLGGPIEFRSSLEVAHDVGRAARLGLVFYHVSNADLYDHNPGSNSLLVVYTLPLAR